MKCNDAYIKEQLNDIATTLKEARNSKGLSQRDLHAISGIPQKTISRIEKGIDFPRTITLIKLLNALELNFKIVPPEENKHS